MAIPANATARRCIRSARPGDYNCSGADELAIYCNLLNPDINTNSSCGTNYLTAVRNREEEEMSQRVKAGYSADVPGAAARAPGGLPDSALAGYRAAAEDLVDEATRYPGP